MKAEAIAKALGGRRVGTGWMACCPAHDDRMPSLSVREGEGGKVLVHCHAGCDQAAVIDGLRARGLWSDRELHRLTGDRNRAVSVVEKGRSDAGRTKAALTLWRASGPATGTPAEAYRRRRDRPG